MEISTQVVGVYATCVISESYEIVGECDLMQGMAFNCIILWTFCGRKHTRFKGVGRGLAGGGKVTPAWKRIR